MNDWVESTRSAPPPEGVLVRVRGSDCFGDFYQVAKKVTYIKPPHKSMKKGCWRWVNENNVRLTDQAIEAWQELPANQQGTDCN